MLDFVCNRLHKRLLRSTTIGRKRTCMIELNDLFRQVPEGMEFVAVLLTILGSLSIMVALGAWWSR